VIEIMAHTYVQTLVDKTSHKKLKIEAMEKEISLQNLLRRIINEHLNTTEEEYNG
jgi:predicted HicB family RNase H-like nuclease